MNVLKFGGAVALSLLLAGCGETQNAAVENHDGSDANLAASQTSEVFSGAGSVTAIAADRITISHGPIKGIGWPAMTMTFAADQSQVAGLRQGDRVTFAFHQQGGRSIITSISKR